MNNWIAKWWWLLSGLLLLGVYIYGYREMFFHQDDLDWFLMANKSFWEVIASPVGDHVNYVFRILLKGEWNIFRLYFPGYLMVSVLMHAIVVWLIYKIGSETSERRDLAAFAALIFTINTNWTEVILWISGQTISITTLFVLLAMLSIWRKRGEVVTLLLASWTSALALGLPAAAFLVYGYEWGKKKILKVGWGAITSVIVVIMIYYWKGTDGTAIAMSWQWVINVCMVWVLMLVNSVIGRLIIPFDRFEWVRIIGVSGLLIWGFYKLRNKVTEIWMDQWSRFLIIQLFTYQMIVAIGRAQYGVGIMRAERYAYLGLALTLLLIVRLLRNWKVGKWAWVIPVLVLVQCAGLFTRAKSYVVRPQQLRTLMIEVNNIDKSKIDPEAYLPHFVLNDERLRYKDLLFLIND